MQPQLGIWKRFIRSLLRVDRCSLSWASGRVAIERFRRRINPRRLVRLPSVATEPGKLKHAPAPERGTRESRRHGRQIHQRNDAAFESTVARPNCHSGNSRSPESLTAGAKHRHTHGRPAVAPAVR